jgi:sugar phosphate isomerase/epimerase
MHIARPLGISTSLFNGTLGPNREPDGIRALQGTGITHIEYFCDDGTRSYTDPAHMAGVKQAVAEAGITVWSCHASFASTDISAPDDAFRAASISSVVAALDAAVGLCAGRVVLHASREPITDEERESRLSLCIGSLTRLCPEASARGLVLALELLPRTCLGNRTAEMRRILEAVGPALRVCVDVNHITLYEGARESLQALEGCVETLHISDHDGVDERHWIPGKGIVDWPAFVAGLDDIGYAGCLIHEARNADLDLAGNLTAIVEAARAHLAW